MADSQSTRSPAFQFYPRDFLSDPNVIVMSLQERGAYITLLCVCWQCETLPSDLDRLARLCSISTAAFKKLWPSLEPCFREGEPGKLVHPRLEKERTKQAEYRQLQSQKGKAGATSRWTQPENSRGHAPVIAPAIPAAIPPAITDEWPEHDSVFVPASSDFSEERTHPRARELSPSEAPELSERAARFLERYDTLHREYRRGAPYMGKPHIDHHEAMQLVRVYDDARLEKLATVWLNADDAFAENGTRTIAKFRSRASWCDERLRERGL